MIDTKKPKEYAAAAAILADPRTLSERGRRTTAFNRRARLARQQHARKPSLPGRLDRAAIG
jgi:hypothetical protein